LYFLAPKCLCRGYKLREREPVPSLKKEKDGVLLEMLISEGENSLFLSSCYLSHPPLYRFKWRPRCTKNPRVVPWRRRRGGAVEVAVAMCPCKCRPSLECHGDVGDGTVKDPDSYGGRAIPCCRRTGVVPLLTGGARGLVGT
jgi:hypothetical protein